MRVVIETVPHSEQRYPTVGDWWWAEDGSLQIRVSKLSNWRRIFLVAYHELFEAMWCKDHCVSQEEVDEFDWKFEARREAGNEDEPGDDPGAPYYKGHQLASCIERLAAVEIGVDWNDYAKEVTNL